MATIGVALAVPDPWGRDLQNYRIALGDETAEAIPTHITLLPPIDVDEVLLPEIEAHLEAAASAVPAYQVHLRGTGTFRPVSPVVFVGVVQGISQCEHLAALVRRGPLAIDAAFPYHPHVTVAHHLPEDVLDRAFDEQAGFDVRFRAESFSLYLHDDRKGWTTARDFPLG